MSVERRNACDIWHPEAPTRLSRQRAGGAPDKNGNERFKIVCLECQRIKQTEHRHKIKRQQLYGVVALNWAPPQV